MNNFQRVMCASRFMRVFGKFKRAQLREKPQRKIGPFSNPVKRLARLKEKERLFCDIGMPRIIPRAKINHKEKLLQVIKPPKVKKEVLERRLDFLLSNDSVYQQLYNKMYNGITPYQCELFMWERQMRDLRKIYRAQYIHKLSEVTNEERNKQIKLLLQTKEDKKKRKEKIRTRILEDKKRRAILKDRISLEKKVNESILFKRQSNIKKKNIYWLNKLQKKCMYLNAEDFEKKINNIDKENVKTDKNDGMKNVLGLTKKSNTISGAIKSNHINYQTDGSDNDGDIDGKDILFNRNISTSALYKDLGYNIREDKEYNSSNFKIDKVYRKLLEESFEFLEEDADQYEEEKIDQNDSNSSIDGYNNNVSHLKRAKILYSSFSNDEKLKLLDEKIAIITKIIEEKSFAKGIENNNIMFYIQLKDKLEASKQSFLEKNYLENVNDKLS
ncbi:conserved protein, unknown function [Hepatocystis sp. ex Piliocolobus tephrosceles]|nr:conserved protein, unknown function [Hepatocystis sp. ex Piliocolobus tephrosceles]